jgi:hypothetical protein
VLAMKYVQFGCESLGVRVGVLCEFRVPIIYGVCIPRSR